MQKRKTDVLNMIGATSTELGYTVLAFLLGLGILGMIILH